jgi:hypothetical protein
MTRSNLLDRYPHGVLTEQEGGVPNDVMNYDRAIHVCRLHRVREETCSEARPRTTVRSMPNKPKTPLHSFRCPDDLWEAAKAKAEARGENWSEELRKMVERYVKRK